MEIPWERIGQKGRGTDDPAFGLLHTVITHLIL